MKKLYSRLLSCSALLLLAVSSVPTNHAQTVASTRVLSVPDGPWLNVDGTIFYHAMSAFWPVGSMHTLWAPSGSGYAYNPEGTIQWQFQGWTWPGGAREGNPITVIANPNITEYRANYSVLYKFTLHFVCDTSSPCFSRMVLVNGTPPPPLNGDETNTDLALWVSPGSIITVQAFSGGDLMFAGWAPAAGQSITGFQNTIAVNAPVTVNANFRLGKKINFATNPPNLQLYADRTLLTPPVSLSWAQGTSHTLGSLDVQQDLHGKRWVFSSWSDGGAPTHTFVAGNNLAPETITANHVAAAYPLFTTSPPNLNLAIDGLILPPPYSYIWGVGQTHRIAAPLTQTDARGDTWTFKSWDDLVATPSRDVTVPLNADVEGTFRLVALYTPQTQVRLTIGSSVAGLAVSVDGTACTTPCSIVRDAGAQVRVSTPASVAVAEDSRQDFLGWSGSGGALSAGEWAATLNAPSTSITANYRLMNRLTASSNPADGAVWNIQPASPDSFYESQTLVSLAVTARPGFRFSNWGGDLSGAAPGASLTMSVPHKVMAQLSRVPYIAPSGVTSAVGALPLPGVASGSVATIFGASLAATTAVGPANPLVQTLAGMVAHIGGRLLPLYFASPEQINLQIPPDLPVGTQTITVSSQGMPDVNTEVTVVRNAPGIFPMAIDGKIYALVLHEDGTLVTPTAPAQKGELLTAYGTGFGPTDRPRPEGLAIPLTPPYLVLDPVTVQVGEAVLAPQSAFAAPGQVGLDLVQFRLDNGVPSGAEIPLSITINGVNSNKLSLPIQ